MSINIEHKDLPLGQNHASFNWKVNNVSDLNLISVVTADINKEAYVEGTKTKYVLKSVNPAVWDAISGAGGEIDATPIDGSNNAVSSSGVYAALVGREPANPNIQSHIISTANPHSTTASQVGAYSMVETDTKIAEAIANLSQTAPDSSIIIAKTTSTQSSNSTTLTPINELTVPVQANTIYRVDCFVTFRSSATAAGAGIGFIAPTDSSPTIEFTTPTVTGASASALHLITPVAAHTANVSIVPSSTPTANTDMTVHIQGLIQTTSAGDFVIQFRTEDAAGTITIQPKSILVVEKIG